MAQIKKGFIAPNAIDGSKLRLLNNEAIRALAADGSDVDLMKVDVDNVLQFLRTPQLSQDPSGGNDLVRKSYSDSYTDSAVSAEQSARESADSVLDGKIDDEEARALAAEGVLDSKIDQEISDRQSAVSAEQSARESADSNLQGQIDTEKGRIDAILLASDADKDSFAEIVSLINSVDTENDQAFASYVLSNDAALAQEVSDRQSGDSTLQSNLDAEEARALAAEGVLQDNIDQEVSDRQAAVSAEESARQSADSDLSDRLDVLEADPVTKTYVDDEVSGLQSQLDSLGSSSAGDLASEVAAREAADNALDARLDVLEGADSVEGSVAKAEKDAKDHADSIVASEQAAREAADSSLQSQINDILGNVDPSALDSLSEIVAAFQAADSDLSAAITSALGTHTSELAVETAAREAADATLQSNIDSEESRALAAEGVLQDNIDAEQSAREAADSALDSRVSDLEAVSEGREKFVITSTDLSNQYLDLAQEAKPDSTFMFYGPLYLHEGDDYTVSVVDGVSRLSFSGRIASGQPSQPIVGDVIYVRYKY